MTGLYVEPNTRSLMCWAALTRCLITWASSYLNRWRWRWFISDCLKLLSLSGTIKSQMPCGLTWQVALFGHTHTVLLLCHAFPVPIPYCCAPLTQSLVWDFSWCVGGFQPVDSWRCPARTSGIWAMLAKLEAWPPLNTCEVSKWSHFPELDMQCVLF